MGGIGRKSEAFFHSWVRQLLPYIDIQPVTKDAPTTTPLPGEMPGPSNAQQDGEPKAKVRRTSAEATDKGLQVNIFH